jgi:YggT family protein
MSGLSSVGYFLIMSLFSAMSFVLWARLFIRYFAVGPFHPLSQTIYTLTAPIITPIQKHIIRGQGARGRYDLACVAVLILFELLKFSIINVAFLNNALTVPYVLLYTVVDMVIQPCNLLFYAIIIRTILSWLNPDWHNPMVNLIVVVTEPILRTLRNALPNFGMLDLSPLFAIIVLKAITIFAASLVPLSIF